MFNLRENNLIHCQSHYNKISKFLVFLWIADYRNTMINKDTVNTLGIVKDQSSQLGVSQHKYKITNL